ncbi:SID1 transmembrane family member 1 [Orchesella cincta]|uniref:SID1 transmembrane family member 1 n=1 Tax=Orchesella cincta TaxID=48709 RepID=A0A1D2M627_ORCCI|nr:SID1 transmembrane family member 1 [Orchesella cincta]
MNIIQTKKFDNFSKHSTFLSCPIFDREDNIHYGGIYQTITSSGALIVEREKPFLDGFIVVIIAHSDHEQCQRRDPFSLPFSNLFSSSLNHLGTPITITITSNDSNVLTSLQILYWMIPILMAIGVALFLFALLFVRHHFIRTTEFHREERMNTWHGRRIRELCMGNFQHNGNSKRASFCYLVFIVGIFYCIPVIQFALYYYQVSIVTGDSDLCYYNYRCAHPVWFFLDFNHIVSNLPYVFFGVMIFIFVKLHKRKLDKIRPVGESRHDANESQMLVGNDNERNQQVEEQNGNVDDCDGQINLRSQPDFGVPLNYDIFQALGVALIAEGVLSASYHLCPNEATFQFDTCFMYVIALLTIVHLFQSRHPHCFSPNHAFLTIVFIVVPTVFSIVGNFLSSTLITIIMSIFLIITFLVSIYVGFKYGFLEQRQDVHAPMRIVTFPNFKKLFMPGTNIYRLRLVLPAGSYWILYRCPLSTYMLYLLVGNMCWNIVYYIFMKTLHGELTLKGCVFPLLYSTITIGFGVYAITFYFHAAARWELSPPASLAVNQKCLTVLGVEYPFDSHDVWHILSATAIFALLTYCSLWMTTWSLPVKHIFQYFKNARKWCRF